MKPVSVSKSFEVKFSLPDCWAPQAPRLDGAHAGHVLTLDRSYDASEDWRLLFPIERAEEIAATFEAVASQVRELARAK